MKQFPIALKTLAPPIQITIRPGTLFDFDQADIKDQGRTALDHLAGKLQAMDHNVDITIGHIDFPGSDAYNQERSEQRAAAIRGYFVGKSMTAARVNSKGWDGEEPTASNATAQARAQNRRVEIEVSAGAKP